MWWATHPGLQRSLFCGVGPAVLDTVKMELLGVAFGGSMLVTVSSAAFFFSGVDIVLISRLSISNFEYRVNHHVIFERC